MRKRERKERIKMEKPKILCYGMKEVPSGLAAVAKKLGAVCRAVPEEEYGMPVAASAAGLPAVKKPEGSISEPFLVFVSFPEGALDLCLAAMRKNGVLPGVLKSVLTQYNAVWTPVKLCEELCRERAMAVGR